MNCFAAYTVPVIGANPSISLERVKALFSYDASTGSLTWRKRPLADFSDERSWKIWNTKYAGKEVGYLNAGGYRQLEIDNQPYLAHRIIWFLITGGWPDNIDHINGVRCFNAFANLRDVSTAENNRNMARPCTNKSGAVGVVWSKQKGKWKAQIWRNGAMRHIGFYPDLNDAVAARLKESRKLGFHPNHGRAAS